MSEIRRFRLFHFPATRSARVKWLLHELLGDDFDTTVVNLYQGEQYQSPYIERNPNHGVPVLELELADGESHFMTESAAMIAWLADAYPARQLAPPPDALSVARADYLQMLHFGATTIDMMLWQIRIHEDLLPGDQRDPRTVQRYREKLRDEIEPQLLQRLSRHDFICGDGFTAADCIIGHDVMWARGYDLFQQDAFRDYLSRISKRPAFAAAFADAQQFTRKAPPGSPGGDDFNG